MQMSMSWLPAWLWRTEVVRVMPSSFDRPAQPSRALDLLLVGGGASQRRALSALLRETLPTARVHEAQGLSDAVHQLAGGGIHAVVIDLAQLGSVSVAATVLLRGLAPGVRLVGLGRAADAPPGMDTAPDAEALRTWLLGLR